MEFEFQHQGVEAGFAQMLNNGFDASVKISTGRGSRTRTDTFEIRRQSPRRDIHTEKAENLVRIAITAFLGRGFSNSNVMHAPCELLEHLAPWDGELLPYTAPR